MLRVQVEVWPGGDGCRAQPIGLLVIWNESDLAAVSDYGFSMWTDGGGRHRGAVSQHDRAAGFWELIRRALEVHKAVEDDRAK